MIVLSWNCRGLENTQTVQDLYLMVKDKCPKVIFLMETYLDVNRLDNIRRKIRFEGCFGVNPIGRSGGLVILWKSSTDFELINYSQRDISGWLCDEEIIGKWKLTGFYGYSEVTETPFMGATENH
ncbi:hypothetical protein I3760_02G112400 [Carya illinoinensis]|nr:hypothetical protein I3760_02G112400 [Carya illinoinensis]